TNYCRVPMSRNGKGSLKRSSVPPLAMRRVVLLFPGRPPGRAEEEPMRGAGRRTPLQERGGSGRRETRRRGDTGKGRRGEERLQIENCKLKIANWESGTRGRGEEAGGRRQRAEGDAE